MYAATLFRRGTFAVAAFLLSALPVAAGPVVLPGGAKIQEVDFERHAQALFGKLGCSAGACHGSFQGKGGLMLSLFGYSPEKDHQAFTREAMGRRVNPAYPRESLLLLKATGQVPHGGGKRTDRDSWEARVLEEWIAGGAAWKAGTGEVKRMEVTPGEVFFDRPGESGRFKVIATFADGSSQDVTAFCQVQITDDHVVQLAGPAEVRGLRPGDTPIVINYRGNVRSIRAMVKSPAPVGFVYPKVPEVNYVDREVFARLRKLNVVPSDLSSDSEFLRRVTIDAIGGLPTPEEVRKFVADTDPKKRENKIDELLKNPLHAALWATKFSDITGNNTDMLEQGGAQPFKRSKMWHDWFRLRLQSNIPYDEIVRCVLTATSREGHTVEDWVKQTVRIEQQIQSGWDSEYPNRKTLDLFWRRRTFPPEQMGEHTAAAFLGIRLECAQCHKHPFDRWTQDDYRNYAQIFVGVRLSISQESQQMAAKYQAELRKELNDALAALQKEADDRKRPVLDRIDREHAPARKEAEDRYDKDAADRRRALEREIAKETEEDKKRVLARFDLETMSERRRVMAAVDTEMLTKKRAASAEIDQQINQKRAELQLKYRFAAANFREVVVVPASYTGGPTRTGPPATAKALGGPEIPEKDDPRVALFEWMRTGDNPFFARAFVNRVWAHYFGRGLVDPVDNFSAANPPSNERLLDALAKDFVESKYDIRKLEKTVLMSRTYQLSAKPNDSNRDDRTNHARSYPRRLMAEQVVDVLNGALGVTENFGPEVPPNVKAVEVAPSRLRQGQNLANVFQLFGRPTRSATCDCERPAEPALPQTLFLMTDPVLLRKITDGRLKDLLASKKTDEEVIDDLMLATLSRFPTKAEKERLLRHVAAKPTRQEGFVDVVWAIINMREFILNH